MSIYTSYFLQDAAVCFKEVISGSIQVPMLVGCQQAETKAPKVTFDDDVIITIL